MRKLFLRHLRLILTEFDETLNFMCIIYLLVILFFLGGSLFYDHELERNSSILIFTVTAFLLLRKQISKISFAGISAELKEKDKEKLKSMYWIEQGDSALMKYNYDLAEYSYRTAIKKDERISLAYIGIADSIRRRSVVDDKNIMIAPLIDALEYCHEAMQQEQKYADNEGVIDKGPIFQQEFLILISLYTDLDELNIHIKSKLSAQNTMKRLTGKKTQVASTHFGKTDFENVILAHLRKAIKAFQRTCLKDVVFKDKGLSFYEGREVFNNILKSDELYQKFKRISANKLLVDRIEEILRG